MTAGFINAILEANVSAGRINRRMGGMEIEFFLQAATVVDVNDPEKISRVRVTYGENRSSRSDWIPVFNNGSGVISSQYLNAKCIVGTIAGNTDNAIVLGFYYDTSDNKLPSSAPISVPILDETDIINNSENEGLADPGAKCSKENEGRLYVFSNNVSQDLKVCVRRNNRQTDPNADVWEWKNMTRGLVVEKKTDPKQVDESSVASNKKPLPTCSEQYEGEQIQYSEDRDFRQTTLVCKKDENKDWAWTPVGAIPTYFRTTLPKCTEKIHGQQAVIDDGNNSEVGICVRMDKEMKWVKYGTRQVIKFADEPEPITKSEMIEGAKPNDKLEIKEAAQSASPSSSVFSGSAGSSLATKAMGVAGNAAAGVPYKTMASSLATGDLGLDVARESGAAVLAEQGITLPQFNSALGDAANYTNLIDSFGPAAGEMIKGGNLDPSQVLAAIGTDGITSGISVLTASEVGMFNSLLVGGGKGALDAAVQFGANNLTGVTKDIFAKSIEGVDLNQAPALLGGLLSSATGGGLASNVSNIAQGLDFSNLGVEGLAANLSGGNFGEVGKIFQDFSNFSSLASLTPGLPSTASALMGAAGLGSPLDLVFPGAGLGLTAATALLGGNNPLSSIIGGGGAFGALGGLFGGGGGGNPCPCDPKCRKTSHATDSDGNKLLDPAGNLTVDNSNVYGSDILNNNSTCLASNMGLSFTDIGAELIPGNLLDFTAAINFATRTGQLSEKLEMAIKGGAEQADMAQELVYSMEAIEKGFKMADNNISMVETVENLLINAWGAWLTSIITGKGGKGGVGMLEKLTNDVRENSQAIRDVHNMARRLDAVKDGGRAGTSPTPATIASLKNIADIPVYFGLSKKEAIKIQNLYVNPAGVTLASLDPLLDVPFGGLETRNNQSKVLNDSLSAKLQLSQPKQDTVNYPQTGGAQSNAFFGSRPPGGINSLSANELTSDDLQDLLSQVQNEQERARNREGDCS